MREVSEAHRSRGRDMNVSLYEVLSCRVYLALVLRSDILLLCLRLFLALARLRLLRCGNFVELTLDVRRGIRSTSRPKHLVISLLRILSVLCYYPLNSVCPGGGYSWLLRS